MQHLRSLLSRRPAESKGKHLRKWILPAAAMAFIGVSTTAIWYLRKPLPPPRIQSIAVLPFENLSGDPSQEYFADGMTEELITELGAFGSFRVISRTSVMRLKRASRPLPEIARELGVDAIVEGTIARSGNHVRITANLLHAPTDRHLWASSYESQMEDVLVVQNKVAPFRRRCHQERTHAHEKSARALRAVVNLRSIRRSWKADITQTSGPMMDSKKRNRVCASRSSSIRPLRLS